ncbi:hypothetical protein [Streptomyces sp. Agncl-13]|uniref:hypothetical protein n=1 Tax=Streptomyces sp. Agncl-13 TaxID=3400628 RepID=UPI003A88F686
MSVGGPVRGPARSNEVAVFVLDDVLVDPPFPHCARGLLGSGHRVRRVLGHGNEPAELFFARVGVERWKLAQVEERLVPDILKGMDVDLV